MTQLGSRPRFLTGESLRSLDEYRERGGIEALERAREMPPEEVIGELRDARLRGRGGAGFLTALKWDGAYKMGGDRRFVVLNGAEGEPGTFKDRYLMMNNPYSFLEGALIAAEVIDPETIYVCIKSKFEPEVESVARAIDEMQSISPMAGRFSLVQGPDEYLFGEETGLLEVIEGGLPLPHWFPPYMKGLFTGAYGGPEPHATLVDNVGTMAHVPGIIRNGPEWFRSAGTDDTPGTMIFTLSGDISRPFVEELPLGMTLRQLIEEVGGGMRRAPVKAVFPGLANALITPAGLDTPLGFDSMRSIGSSLGAGGFIVYDEQRCMVQVAYEFARFLHTESCGQCSSCKLGSRVIMEALANLVGDSGTPQDIETIGETTGWVENAHRCYLPTSTSLVVGSILANFRGDFINHLTGASCPLDHDIVLPKIVDYHEGEGFTYDSLYARKQPDWSYAMP